MLKKIKYYCSTFFIASKDVPFIFVEQCNADFCINTFLLAKNSIY